MRRHASVTLLTCALASSACFVSEGECVSNGITIEPCAASLRPGQTLVLSARAGDAAQPVGWVASDFLNAGFHVNVVGNSMELVGKSGQNGVYRVRAEDPADPEGQYAEATLVVSTASYGYPPPPIQIIGPDGPPASGALAAAADRYYFAYADQSGNPRGGGAAAPMNHFVRQFRLSSNSELAVVPDQFLEFGGDVRIEPNAATDCAGAGYWIDVDAFGNTVLQRLLPNSRLEGPVPFGSFCAVTAVAVSCDGAIYVLGEDGNNDCVDVLLRASSFGAEAEEVAILDEIFLGAYDRMAVSPDGLLYLADDDFQTSAALVRFRISDPGTGPQAELDETFRPDPQPAQVKAFSIDANGLIYVAGSFFSPVGRGDSFDTIQEYNALGEDVGSISTYCPEGCVDCNGDDPPQVPFQNIRAIAAGTDGRLRILDDVFVGSDPATDPCQVTLRLIVLDP